MEYQPDIFYNTAFTSKNQFKKLFKEAKELSFNWWVDEHPEFKRIKIEMPFEKVLNIFFKTTRKNLHITFIHRRGYENWEQYLEIGFCTLNGGGKHGDIFLWIQVDLKHKEYLLKKYFNIVATL